MRSELVALAIFVCSTLAGCGTSTPGCGDEETLNLVKEVVQRELGIGRGQRVFAYGGEVKGFTLEYVTTTAHDKELDTYTCSASLEVTTVGYTVEDSTPFDKKRSVPITFDVRLSATDPTQFVVQVYGLR